MDKLKIGLVGTSQLSFPGDKEAAFRHSCEGMERLADQMGFELCVYHPTVITEEDARKSVAFFEQEKIDFLMMQHTSYSSGFLSLVYAKMKGVRLGYWAIPEGVEEGIVPFNSMCSINMHQAIVYHYLKEDILVEYNLTDKQTKEIEYWWGGKQYLSFDALYAELAEQKRFMELIITTEA